MRRLAPVAPQCDNRCFQKVEAQSLPDEGDCLRVLLTGLSGHICCSPVSGHCKHVSSFLRDGFTP